MSPVPRVSINAALRSSKRHEAYIFMNNEYVLLSYGLKMRSDKVLNGGRVIQISNGFPSLKGTRFGEHGIDCAFDTVRNEAYIFSGDLCAHIDYAPETTGDEKILKGPMSISVMFPSLKGTMFENGIDAAFNPGSSSEVYIFKGDRYARLNYTASTSNMFQTNPRAIKDEFPCLKGTIFESGIEAAFASHMPNQAYIFKGDQYALINFVYDSREDDYMVGGKPGLISRYWPDLGGVLASKNGISK